MADSNTGLGRGRKRRRALEVASNVSNARQALAAVQARQVVPRNLPPVPRNKRAQLAQQYAQRTAVPERTGAGTPQDNVQEAARAAFQRKGLNEHILKRETGMLPGYQKQIYGKNYKIGTVGRENAQIQKQQARLTGLNKRLERAQSMLADPNVTDPNQRAAFQKMLEVATSGIKNTQSRLTQTKDERQKFLDIRDKFLRNAYINQHGRPADQERAREQAVRNRLRKDLSLRQRLEQKGLPSDQIEQILAQQKNQGLHLGQHRRRRSRVGQNTSLST